MIQCRHCGSEIIYEEYPGDWVHFEDPIIFDRWVGWKRVPVDCKTPEPEGEE